MPLARTGQNLLVEHKLPDKNSGMYVRARLFDASGAELPESPVTLDHLEDGLYRIKIGKAKVLAEGSQITVVTYGAMVRTTQQALQAARKTGISVELIDLRTIYPIDTETVMESVKKTGRLLVIHEGPRSFGVAAELIAQANEEAFLHLEAPPARVTGNDTIPPLPKSEEMYIPSAERIFYKIKRTVEF